MTRTQLRRFLIVVLAAAIIVATEVIGYEAAAFLPQPWSLTRSIVHTFSGLSFVVCAWIAWQVADSPVPARLMIAIAFLWITPSFIAATWQNGMVWPLLESVGVIWAVLQAVLVAVYPTGRLVGRLELWAVVVGSAGGLVRMLAVIFVAPAPNALCDCAPNAYVIWPNAELYSAIDTGYRLIGIALIFTIIVVVSVRWSRGSTPARNIAFAMPIALILWCAAIAYEVLSDSLAVPPSALFIYLGNLATASIPISFVAGLAYIRSLRGRVSDLVVLTRDGVDRDFWQPALADTLRDQRVRVYWWDPRTERYLDSAGLPLDEARPISRSRARMAIDTNGHRLGLVDHDSALTETHGLLDAVASAMRLSVDNGRLREELEETLQEVRQSRVRIIEAGLVARRQIERDLHDGSQQSLVSLALSLRMAVAKARTDGNEALAVELEAALAQLSDALRQLRELARGIHPSSLTVGGLGMAIGELVARSPVPIEVDVRVPERVPPLTESTIYFFIAECLTNIAKYAGASRGRLTVSTDDAGMRVVVSDDGHGGAEFGKGSGLIGLVDRIEALGGSVDLESDGAGTTVQAHVPPSALT